VSLLLDTNVVSELSRQRPDEGVLRWLARTPEELTYLSVVTIGELRRGTARMPSGARREELERWLAEVIAARYERRVIDVTADIANAWGSLLAFAERAGRGIHPLDAYIAATARIHSLVLVTRNTKDFSSLGIELLNPWQSTAGETP
jgi:predicted nucleic acid-binding protein